MSQTYATAPEWSKTADMINGLWPDWDATDYEREIFPKRLRALDQLRLRDAVERTYEERHTTRPSLAHIMGHYRALSPPSRPRPRIDMSDGHGAQIVGMRGALQALDSRGINAAIEHAVGRYSTSSSNADPGAIDRWNPGQVGTVWSAAADLGLVH